MAYQLTFEIFWFFFYSKFTSDDHISHTFAHVTIAHVWRYIVIWQEFFMYEQNLFLKIRVINTQTVVKRTTEPDISQSHLNILIWIKQKIEPHLCSSVDVTWRHWRATAIVALNMPPPPPPPPSVSNYGSQEICLWHNCFLNISKFW